MKHLNILIQTIKMNEFNKINKKTNEETYPFQFRWVCKRSHHYPNCGDCPIKHMISRKVIATKIRLWFKQKAKISEYYLDDDITVKYIHEKGLEEFIKNEIGDV